MNNKLLVLTAGLFLSTTGHTMSGAPADADIASDELANHKNSWEYKALSHQNILDNAVPIAQGYNSSSHNAFNSSAYSSIVYIDPNHTLSMFEQLEIGVRNFELDVHWTWQTKDIPNGDALLLCHSRDQRVGCSGLERYFSDAVHEINHWLRRNPNEVVYLGFEDFWADNEDKMIQALAAVDDLIYKPGSCTNFQQVATTLTEEEVLRAGKQLVLLNGDCATSNWAGYAFQGGWGYTSIEAATADNCLTANASWNGAGVQRIFEQDTFFGNLGTALGLADDNGLFSDETIAKAQRCGVNQIAYDKLVIGDPGLKASIWSWDINQPDDYASNEDCAESWGNGRFNDLICSASMRFACKTTDGRNWAISDIPNSHSEANGEFACQALGAQWHFAVPTNSMQNELLKNAKAAAGVERVWLNYNDTVAEGVWTTPQHTQNYNPLLNADFKEFNLKHDTNKCLDVAGAGTANGSNVLLWDCHGGDNQKWVWDAAGRLRPGHAPQMCLDIEGNIHAVGQNIVIRDCNDPTVPTWVEINGNLYAQTTNVVITSGSGANGSNVYTDRPADTTNKIWYHGFR